MRIGFRTVLLLILFVIPLALFSYYELRVATDRYHSDSIISITQGGNSSPALDLSMIGLPTVAGDKDALSLIAYITSLDMLQHLDLKLQLRQHYSDPKIDWHTRLPAEASLEDFHTYIQNYITVSYDSSSYLITIHVEAFSREYAQQVVNAVLANSQDFVDHLNSRVTVEQTKFFENQLKVSEARLREAKNDLLKFQRDNGFLTTDTEAQMITTSIGSLNAALLSKQADLDTKRRELNENSTVIQGLKADIEIIKQQIAGEKQKLSMGGGSGTSTVSELAAKFAEIQYNLDFVNGIYKSNLTQLESVRVQAAQRLKYLIIVTAPSVADASMYPSRLYNIGTAAIMLIMAYFVLSLLVAIIREHA